MNLSDGEKKLFARTAQILQRESPNDFSDEAEIAEYLYEQAGQLLYPSVYSVGPHCKRTPEERIHLLIDGALNELVEALTKRVSPPIKL